VYKKWTDDNIEELRSLVAEGLTAKLIAIKIGRTNNSVHNKCHRLGIKSKNYSGIILTNEIVDERLKDRNITRIGTVINARSFIKVKCNICKDIWSPVLGGLLNGKGCPTCADLKPLTNEIINERLKDRNIFIVDEYIDSFTKVDFLCDICEDIFNTTPNHILYHNSGCPSCAEYGFKLNHPAVTYCIYFNDLNLYKIGITGDYKTRFAHFGYKPEIIFLRKFELGKDAKGLEAVWLKNIKEFKINTGLLSSGNTETFIYE